MSLKKKKKNNIKRRENNTWIDFHWCDLTGRCFLLNLPTHLHEHPIWNQESKVHRGKVTCSKDRQWSEKQTNRICGARRETHLFLQVPTPHCLDITGATKRLPMSIHTETQQPLTQMWGLKGDSLPLHKVYGSCLHLPNLHLPHKHIHSLIRLPIPSFFHWFFLPFRLPKLLTF